MRCVRVEVAGGYSVWIGRGALERAAGLPGVAGASGTEPPPAWALISDPTVHRLHGGALREALRAWDAPAATILLPEGEAAKTWEVAGDVLRRLASAALGRDAVIVAAGGGAVGDVAGFVAGTYARGVAFVNVPTTLVAAADASIGGKTGVNLPEGKNLAGVFHQPRAVLIDPELLRTLPVAEWRNGWAEVVKIAITSDPTLFELLEAHAPVPPADVLEEMLERACRAKAQIVARDERDVGERRVLNFGHTVGHAIEAAGGYRRHAHGEAVALGISCALELGERLGVTPPAVAARCRALLERYGLPTRGAGYQHAELLPFLERDKKKSGATLAVLLTVQIGKPILRPLLPGDSDLREAIRAVA